jgi:hypothetical protein
MMIAITAGFRFPSAAHSSHVPNRRINIVVGLRRYRGWSDVTGPVIRVPFTAFTTTDPESNWPHIYGLPTIHTPQTCMNPYGAGAFQSKKFSHLSLPSTYVHNTRHFSLQLCWTPSDWMEHRWSRWNWTVSVPVGVERNSARRHI